MHRSIREPFLESLVRVAGEFTLGNPLEAGVTLGPVHNQRQAEHVARHIQDATAKGARIVAGGLPRPGFPTAFYFPPTVIDAVRPEMLPRTGHGLQRGGGGRAEQVLKHFLVLQRQGIELFGNGEDHVEIGDRR